MQMGKLKKLKKGSGGSHRGEYPLQHRGDLHHLQGSGQDCLIFVTSEPIGGSIVGRYIEKGRMVSPVELL